MAFRWIIHPLCSRSITDPFPLVRGDPPLCSASVLWLSWGFHLSGSLTIGTTGSQVALTSLKCTHATFTPDAALTVSGLPQDLSRVNDSARF